MSAKICIAQTNHAYTTVDAQMALMQKMVQEAAQHNADLIIFPELFINGYAIAKEQIYATAKNMPIYLQQVQHMAKQYQICIIVGFAEFVDDDLLPYNSCAFFDTHGQMLHKYNKMHLWNTQEKLLYKQAKEADFTIVTCDTLKIVDFSSKQLRPLRIMMLICYDLEIVENARIAALCGADLIAVPTANTDSKVNCLLAPARAMENHVFVAYANKSGKEHVSSTGTFCGLSCICAPNGDIIAQAPKESTSDPYSLLFATCEYEPYAEDMASVPYLQDRRPELYAALTNK